MHDQSVTPTGVHDEPTVQDELDELATRVHRLIPDRRDPEHFHVEKSDVVHKMRKLARRIGAAR